MFILLNVILIIGECILALNLMKKNLLLLLFIPMLLTGCTNYTTSSGTTDLNPKKVHINFNAFSKSNTNDVNTASISKIDLTEVTNEEIIKIKQIVSAIYDTLGQYDYFMTDIDNNTAYYNSVKQYFTDDFYTTLVNHKNDYIYKTITDLYKIDNCGYYKTNVIELKKDSNSELKIKVEILGIQNQEKIYGKTDEITLNNDYKISNITSSSNFTELEKSTTPLNENIIENPNEKFENQLKILLSSISNKYLYENYHSLETNTMEYKTKEEKEEKMKEIELQIKTLIEKDELDIETMKELFLIGEGTFKDYGITSYSVRNTDNLEDSIYKVGFIHNKKIYYFDFTYNRILDKITNVEKSK